MKLYHRPPSGHSHRARLFLSLLGAPHQLVEVDPRAGAYKTPAFLRRIEALPGFIPFVETPVGLSAAA